MTWISFFLFRKVAFEYQRVFRCSTELFDWTCFETWCLLHFKGAAAAGRGANTSFGEVAAMHVRAGLERKPTLFCVCSNSTAAGGPAPLCPACLQTAPLLQSAQPDFASLRMEDGEAPFDRQAAPADACAGKPLTCRATPASTKGGTTMASIQIQEGALRDSFKGQLGTDSHGLAMWPRKWQLVQQSTGAVGAGADQSSDSDSDSDDEHALNFRTQTLPGSVRNIFQVLREEQTRRAKLSLKSFDMHAEDGVVSICSAFCE